MKLRQPSGTYSDYWNPAHLSIALQKNDSFHTTWFWQFSCQESRDQHIFGSFTGLKFPVWFYSRPNKAKGCAKVQAFFTGCFIPIPTLTFIALDLNLAGQKGQQMGWEGVCFVFSRCNAPSSSTLYCLPHFSFCIQVTVHSSLTLHLPTWEPSEITSFHLAAITSLFNEKNPQYFT